MKKRILTGLILGLIAGLIIGVPVLAAVSQPANFTAQQTDTTVSLLWTPGTGSTKTMVRFSTTAFPTSATGVDGSTQIYLDSSNNYTHSNLTPGKTYYYSAWGWNVADGYSTLHASIACTTDGAPSSAAPLPTPTVPSNMNQLPQSSSWFDNLQPFTGAIQNFALDWGMPLNNMMVVFIVIIMGGLGIATYWKTRNIFISYGVILVVDLASVALHLMFWWSIPIMLAFGLGIWALEHNFA
jgi:hypothetical protein